MSPRARWALRWGLRRDVWTAVQPDLRTLIEPIRRANGASPTPTPAQAIMLAALAERYEREAPPARFRALVSPLVAWIWVGGLIVALGRSWRCGRPATGAAAPCSAPTPPGGPRGARRVDASPPTSASSRGPEGAGVEYPLAVIALGVLVALVVALAAARCRGAGAARGRAPGRARGAPARDLPRDPRHRARLPHGQALPDDYRRVDRELRTKAIAILRELDELAPDGAAPGTR